MNHEKSEIASSTKHRPWPLILFVTAILVGNLVAFNLISVFGLWTFGHVVPGFLLGEILSTSIIVGLFGRSWLSGLFFGICLSYAGIFALFFGQQMQFSFLAFSYVSILNPTGSWAWIWGAFFVPLVCLIISVPFYLMRLIFGWQLVRDKAICVPREPIRLIDFFLIMASLASVLWMAQVPDLAWDNGSSLTSSNVIGSSCALCIYSAFVAVPATYGTFRFKNKRTGAIVALCFAMVPAILLAFVFEMIALFMQSGSVGSGALSILLTSFAAGSVVSIGLWSLRSSGYQLQYYARGTPIASRASASQIQVESIPPAFSNDESGLRENENQVDSTLLDVEEKLDDSNVLAYPHFRWTLLFVIAAILSSVVSAGLNSFRHNRDSSIVELRKQLEASESTIALRDREVVSLTLGQGYDPIILADGLVTGSVEMLSFQNSQLPDDLGEILSRFPKLRELDLGYTDLNDESLDRIRRSKAWARLQHVSVAGTKVSLPRTSALTIGNDILQSVDLSDLGISDANIEQVSLLSGGNQGSRWMNKIRLANNGLTDEGLKKIAGSLPTELLDLSGNQLKGAFFQDQNYNRYGRLVLDGNPLSESDFGAAFESLRVRELVLRYTPLTDSFANLFSKKNEIFSLELGDGNFTDAGLSMHLSPNKSTFNTLLLTGKQFSGECFKNWKPAIFVLSLKGSGLTDDNIVHVNSLPALRSLDLSDTALSNAGLAQLNSMLLNQLDITNTQVTAQGVMDCHVNPLCSIIVGPDQFTRTELQRLRTKWRIEFKAPTPFQ
jgi:hypothetical protein